MNEDMLRGRWKQVRGKIQQKWGELTDDDMDQIEGRREEAESRVDEFFEDWDDVTSTDDVSYT